MLAIAATARRVIVSRHPAAVAFIREAPEFADAPVMASAVADDVRDAVVAGNVPLHLAALAREVVAVEFEGDPPRGAEYGVEEMRAAGARLVRYRVADAAEAIALVVAYGQACDTMAESAPGTWTPAIEGAYALLARWGVA